MTRALASLVTVLLAGACAREAAIAPSPRTLDVPPIEAGAPPPSPRAAAMGEVNMSLLSRQGGHWGPYLTMSPEAAKRMKGCYAEALARDPGITGWAIFEVGPFEWKPSLADSSALPRPLLVCLEQSLRLPMAQDSPTLPESLVYVTLR